MLATALNDADPTRPTLEIDTPVGRLSGVWRGTTGVGRGKSVDVELELRRARALSEVVISPRGNPAHGRLRGVVTAVFGEGVIVVQIGGVLLQVEFDGDGPTPEIVGVTVEFTADDLEFYPTGV